MTDRDISGRNRIVEEIIALFETQGDAAYFGEPVSQRDHALQAAHLAEAEGATDSLIVAALLHDIGHLLHHLPEDIAAQGVDAQHEVVGDRWLRHYFGPAVTEPARLHVAAKRYLCAVEPGYADQLSPASQQSLKLQNGPFTAAEVADFETNPFFRDAVRLRHWDDTAKVSGLAVPPVAYYRSRLEKVILS